MLKKIVVIEPLGVSKDLILEKLSTLNGYEVIYFNDRKEDEETLIKRGLNANILVVSNIVMSKRVLSKFSKLEMICVAFTGVDHIDTNYCQKNNILVSNASGYATQGVVELTFGLIFDLYRNIKIGDKEVRAGLNHNNRLGFEIANKKFGIVGAGAIGSEVARLANAFNAKVSIYNRSMTNLENVRQTSLENIFSESDIISIHLPLNKDTKGMINADLLALMKKDAILINTARGPIIDNDFLAKLLNENKIAGAGIDVFDYEPPIKSEYQLLKAKNTTLSPHIAYFTHEAMEKRFEIVYKNIVAFINEQPINVIK